jgi:hypothetical protein
VGEDEDFHFYGIILEATYPHKSFKTNKFICTLKIADPYQPINEEGIIQHCTLVLFANKMEDLPISQRVGDIIRVHRATLTEFHGLKVFQANVFFKSSWALFSPVTLKDRLKNEMFIDVEELKKVEDKEFWPF